MRIAMSVDVKSAFRAGASSMEMSPQKCSCQMRLYLSWASYFFSGALVCAIAALFVFSSIGSLPEGEPTCWGRPASAEIFAGITYGCKILEPSDNGSGVVHWVRINLTAPGIAPYVTSKEPTAVSQGWQYRLRRVADVVASEHLAVAINGTLFSSKSSWRRRSGDLANAVNPVVADHIISHVWLDTYLLWFDDQLTPHLGPNKTTEAELAMAKWGIGGEDFWLRDGEVWSGDRRCFIPDGRTAVAVDLPRKLLFLAVGTHISPNLIFQTLANLGARDGMLLDGGDSSSMAIGTGASVVSPGAVYGWRPVANQFGVRAEPLR
jgi:Phosphodiester glycosidase